MARFRKKPVFIDAIQWVGDNFDEIYNFVGGSSEKPYLEDSLVVIHTLEGDHTANEGDWIIKGVQGEFYPCKPNIFDQTYDPVA